MIRKLKFKFILLSMTTLVTLISVILIGMNVINYNSVTDEADTILSMMSENKGRFPELGDKPIDKLPPHISPETPYESRYFSVFIDADGQIIHVDTVQISSVTPEAAEDFAQRAFLENSKKGFVENFRYAVNNEGAGTRITFLDTTRSLDSFYSFLRTSIIMGVAGLLVVFAVIFVLSGRIIKPIAESHEKQKRFITDAGHEIKTPLTIINANADILEMELGEDNESLTDIKEQVERLRCLTEELVILSKMEEAEDTLQKIDFPISEIVSETTHSFSAPIQAQNKNLSCSIQPLLTLNGNDKSISRLVSILLENALKYSTPQSEISLVLEKQSHGIALSVSNKTDFKFRDRQLEHIFDRFYRAEASHNSETGGHGIGLSVAKAIVAAHGGKITAHCSENGIFKIIAIL